MGKGKYGYAGYGNYFNEDGAVPSKSWSLSDTFNSDNGFGGMFDTSKTNKWGGVEKTQGWGAPVANLAMQGWQLYNQNQAQEAMQEDADKRFNFMENESKKNWAMKMNQYRQFQNSRAQSSAKAAAYRDEGGRHLRSNEIDRFSDNGRIVDRFGNTQADPFAVDGSGNVTTPAAQMTNPITGGPTPQMQVSNINNIAGSAFAPAAPVNPIDKVASKITTTPQERAEQGAGKSIVKKKGPNSTADKKSKDLTKVITS